MMMKVLMIESGKMGLPSSRLTVPPDGISVHLQSVSAAIAYLATHTIDVVIFSVHGASVLEPALALRALRRISETFLSVVLTEHPVAFQFADAGFDFIVDRGKHSYSSIIENLYPLLDVSSEA